MKLNHRLVQRTYNTCKALISTAFINMLEYDRIDLSYQQVKNVICVVIGTLLIRILIIKNICVMVVMIYLQKLLVCITYV